MARLAGKVALVTGGAGAIGGATARRLAADGARVAVADLDPRRTAAVARQISETGGTAQGWTIDVTRDDSVRGVIEGISGAWGAIDVLFACAGVLIPGTAVETELADWERTLAVNVTGSFLCAKHVLPGMTERGAGSIVLMSSTAGLVAEAGIAAYCASKGAVVMLGRQLAVDYARSGVRVNVVCPGWIDTPFNDPAIERSGGREALAPFIDVMIPMGRQGHPDEIADVVAFLASDEARLMTGAVLPIDGGLTAQ